MFSPVWFSQSRLDSRHRFGAVRGVGLSTPMGNVVLWAALISAVAVVGCAEQGGSQPGGSQQGGSEQGGSEQGSSEQAGTAQGGARQAGSAEGSTAEGSAQHAQADRAADLPRKVTAGDVLPPLPPLPRRLASGGSDAAPELPNISCARMAPDGTFKLAKRVEVTRLGRDVVTTATAERSAGRKGRRGRKNDADGKETGKAAKATGKAAKAQLGTLELCLFHQWRAREPGENRTHTGRIHHFVAAFPGDEAASWTSEELTRIPKTLPEDARWLSAGWAALLPTGLPDSPALAIVSGRFFDGVHGEEVHYIREARLLQRKDGRWGWVPWMTQRYHSLDIGHLRSACNKPSSPACQRAAGRIAKVEQARERRLKIRDRRLAGRARMKAGKFTRDPQSAWIALGRQLLRKGRWRQAINLALKSEVVCGEASRESRALMGRALQRGGIKAELAEPAVTRRPLCAPLVDKPAPKTRKLVPTR